MNSAQKSLSFLALIMATTGPGSGQPESLEAKLIGMERQSWGAWQGRDGGFFERFLSDDHVEVGFRGLATKAQVVATVASPRCVVRSYRIEAFRVTRFDAHSAVVNYRAEQNTQCNGTPVPSPVWVTSLYVKRGDRWLNALYQQTQALP